MNPRTCADLNLQLPECDVTRIVKVNRNANTFNRFSARLYTVCDPTEVKYNTQEIKENVVKVLS